ASRQKGHDRPPTGHAGGNSRRIRTASLSTPLCRGRRSRRPIRGTADQLRNTAQLSLPTLLGRDELPGHTDRRSPGANEAAFSCKVGDKAFAETHRGNLLTTS